MTSGRATPTFDPRSLAKTLTQIENRGVVAKPTASRSRVAQRVGLTGSPGAGKSSLISALIRVARERGLTVAVLCIDPSSPKSGGALLGDRIRMTEHLLDPGVFVRSFASRGAQGGLSETAGEAADYLAASGFDLLFLETVGAGQGDVDVAAESDTTLVLFSPGSGDSIQAMKSGLMEVADFWVVTKCDQPGAESVKSDLVQALSLLEDHASLDERVLLTSAAAGQGVSELLDAVLAFGRRAADDAARRTRLERRFARRLSHALSARAAAFLMAHAELRDRLLLGLAQGTTRLEDAVNELLRNLAAKAQPKDPS